MEDTKDIGSGEYRDHTLLPTLRAFVPILEPRGGDDAEACVSAQVATFYPRHATENFSLDLDERLKEFAGGYITNSEI